MENTFKTLEINKILEETLSYSKSELNESRILNIRPIESFESLSRELKLTDEMMCLIMRFGQLPLTNSKNLASYLLMAKKGGILTPLDLDHVASDIKNVSKIVKYFSRLTKSDFPLTSKICEQLIDLTPLEESIRNVILPSLDINTDASPKLRRIRRKIAKLEEAIRSRASSLMSDNKLFLSDEAVTIKDGHFVLPVLNAYKNKVGGLIHGFSDTRQTVFVEPQELVELNNELIVTQNEEKEEIKRLLKMLTLKLIDEEDNLINNNELIARLDFLSAKANYGINHDALIAKLTNESLISLKGARHPLISKDVVIPNDFLFNPDLRMIIISGPNAGGKTVAIKTFGTLLYLNKIGFPLTTASPATIGNFNHIYVDIGDNQSLSENLSTFAGHIKTIANIIRVVQKDDIVLLDELGTGTAPKEGEALAIAIADYLLSKGAISLISSHFEAMKEYAFTHEKVQNAMLAFDENKLAPTYKLKVGLPGQSYGLIVAKNYHLDEGVVRSAETILEKANEADVSNVMKKLEQTLKENEKLKTELFEKEKALNIKLKSLENREAHLKEKQDKLLESVEEEKNKIIENARLAVDDALKIIRKKDYKEHELISAKSQLKSLLVDDHNEIESLNAIDKSILTIGSYVKLSDLGLVGKVTQIKGEKVYFSTSDGLSASSKISQLEVVEPPKEIKPTKEVKTLRVEFKTLSPELNLIGDHIDEAIPKVERYLNEAYVRHLKEVRLIHGMGSGRLRDAIRQYLKTVPFVLEFKYAENNAGGQGATIVTFK